MYGERCIEERTGPSRCNFQGSLGADAVSGWLVENSSGNPNNEDVLTCLPLAHTCSAVKGTKFGIRFGLYFFLLILLNDDLSDGCSWHCESAKKSFELDCAGTFRFQSCKFFIHWKDVDFLGELQESRLKAFDPHQEF